jgi:hypothetical protein
MDTNSGLGYWVISGEGLLDMLWRCRRGEQPDIVYAEEYANSSHATPTGE